MTKNTMSEKMLHSVIENEDKIEGEIVRMTTLPGS
jgi:hypothetical protein